MSTLLDKDYLRRTAYPLLKGNAEFLLDYMVEDPNTGYMVTGPCVSPEKILSAIRGGAWSLHDDDLRQGAGS